MDENPEQLQAGETIAKLREERDYWKDECGSYRRVIEIMKDDAIKEMKEWREVIKTLAGVKPRGY